jgi:hypothetical protein
VVKDGVGDRLHVRLHDRDGDQSEVDLRRLARLDLDDRGARLVPQAGDEDLMLARRDVEETERAAARGEDLDADLDQMAPGSVFTSPAPRSREPSLLGEALGCAPCETQPATDATRSRNRLTVEARRACI